MTSEVQQKIREWSPHLRLLDRKLAISVLRDQIAVLPRGNEVSDDEINKIIDEPPAERVSLSIKTNEGSEVHRLIEMMKLPGVENALKELAAIHAKKEEAAKTCFDYFRSVGEMEDGEIVQIIDGVLQEGICFIGATPASGKTLVALSFAKAICTGKPLFGVEKYKVKEPSQVVYLIPESGDHAFRKRCEAFGIPNDKRKFMARTISAGVPLELKDPILLEAVRQTKPVVFLDTASRFMKSTDENAAAQNRQLVNDVISLLAAGAVTVVLVHHATKASADSAMTLENMLRGSSDLGAMCDQAYGIRKDAALYANGAGPMEIDLVSLKDREQLGGLTSLRLAASCVVPGRAGVVSHINESGDFVIINYQEIKERDEDRLINFVKADPSASPEEIKRALDIKVHAKTITRTLNNLGWHRVKGGPDGASPWHTDNGEKCRYVKEQENAKAAKQAEKKAEQEAKALKEKAKAHAWQKAGERTGSLLI
jgi:hypothetical protein